MKYIDAEKLKAEIDNLESLSCISEEQDGFYSAISRIYDLIDSLQKEEPIQTNTLTWKDINDLERIINNVHYEFRNGIGEKSFGEEVLERFREERDEQPEVDLEKEIDAVWNPRFNLGWDEKSLLSINRGAFETIARHFYGLRNRALEEAARHVYESWMGGTMDDVRRDMVELGRVINARKEG